MRKNALGGMLGALCIILAIIALALFAQNRSMSSKIAASEKSLQQLDKNFKTLKSNYELLKKENLDLKEENRILNLKSSSLSDDMKRSQIELDMTIDKLSDFETTVKNSIDWFKQNNNIKDLSAYDDVKKDLAQCAKFKDNCEIDLKCIYKINKNHMFRYRSDETTTGKNDFLKDLQTIYDQSGGDCEDISLLYRAEYNYLLGRCLKNYTRERIVAIADDKKFENNYMYIVCGTFDPKKVVGNWAGHCLVGLSKNPIFNSLDIYPNIKDSILIEPQTGEFYADMTKDDVIKVFDNDDVPDTLHYVDFVITDDDLNIFYPYGEDISWMGYNDFLEVAKLLQEGVEK